VGAEGSAEAVGPSAGADGDAARGLPHETQPDSAVSVVSQETHVPPVPRLTPVQQIADAISDAASGELARPAVALPGARSLPPLRVLNIVLDPPDLGAVSVKMRMSGTKLDIDIAVSRKDVAALIGKDGETLSRSLQSSGYGIDAITIKEAVETGGTQAQHRHDPSQGAASGQQQSSFQTPSGSGQPGAMQSGGGRQHERASANPTNDAAQPGRNEVASDVPSPSRLGGDLYV